MRLFARLAAVCALTLGLASAWAAPDFSRPNNHLGNADSDGNFCLWVDVVTVALKDGTHLPLRLRFNGGPGTGAPLFGKFWWSPLLESTLVPCNERIQLFTTLGGRQVYLVAKKDGTFASQDGRFTAKVTPPSETIITGEGWEYRYVGGKLREAKEINGPVDLLWEFQGSRLSAITNKSGGAVLSLEYATPGGIPSAIMVDKVRYDLKTQQVPLITSVSGVPMVAGYGTSLAEIQNSTVNQSFPIHFERDGSYVMDFKSNFWAANTYTWEAVSGALKSDNTWTYEGKKNEEGMLTERRKNQAGGIESYFYDTAKGASEMRNLDGSITTRLYFNAPGPTQYKIRKVVTTKNGKDVFDWQCSYDEAGRLVRERSASNKYEKICDWHPDGTLASETVLADGKEFEKKSYDESGRIVDRTAAGQSFHFVYQEGKTVVQKIVNGKVADVRIPAGPGQAPAYFLVGEGGQLKLPGQAVATNTNSPAGKINADALALAQRVLSNPAAAVK